MATIEEKVKLLKELAGKAKKIKQKEQKRKAIQQDSIKMMRNIATQPYRTFDNQSIDNIRQNQIDRNKQVQLDSIRNMRTFDYTKPFEFTKDETIRDISKVKEDEGFLDYFVRQVSSLKDLPSIVGKSVKEDVYNVSTDKNFSPLGGLSANTALPISKNIGGFAEGLTAGSMLKEIENRNASKTIGEITSYISPYSIPNALFKAGEKLATKGIEKTGLKLGNKLINSLVKNAATDLVGTGAIMTGQQALTYTPYEKNKKDLTKENLVESGKNIAFNSLLGIPLGAGLRGVTKIPGLGKYIINKTGIADELKFGETADIAGRGGIADTVDIYKLKKSPEIKAKTSTKNYKFKNVEAEKAWKNYDEAIETIQNHYGTYELRQSEINSIKNDLGIDLNKLIKNIEKAENLTPKQIAEKAKYQRVVGLGNKKVENIRKISSGKNKLPTYQNLKEKFSYKNNKEKIVNNDYSKESFNKRYNLDKDISKLSELEKANFEKETVNKMLKDSGNRISKNIESYNPKQAVKYYSEKYNFEDNIKVDDTLQGSKNIAELTYKKDSKGNLKDFTIKYNKNISDDDIILGAIRHELEHYRDIKSGYESPKDFIPNQKSNTLLKMYEGGKHNKYYDWFEPEYLRRSEIKEALSKGEKIDKAILDELNIDSSKINKIDEISSQNLKGENIPNEKINKINNEISSIKNKMNQKNISQEEIEMLKNKLNEKNEIKRNFLRTSLDSSKELSNKIINTPDINYNIAPVKSNLKSKVKNKFESIYSELVDDFHPLRGSKITKTKSEQRLKDLALKTQKEASNYKKYHGTVHYIVTENLVNPNGEIIGNSLSKIMNRPNNDIFTKYLVYKTHINRMMKKNPQPALVDIDNNPISIEESKKVVDEIEKAIPDIKDSASDLYKFNDDLYENWLYDFISPENFKKMKELDPNWVPIMRDIKIDPQSYQSGRLTNKPIKTAVGGTDPIIDLNQAMPLMVQRTIRANRKNAVYKSLFENALSNPESSKYYTITKINGKELGEEGLEQLKKFQNIENPDSIENIIDNTIESKKGRFVVAMIDSKPNVLKIHDNNLWTALKKMNVYNTSSLDTIIRLARKATNKVKAPITTYNPITATRGIIKDLPDSYIYSAEHRPDKFSVQALKSIKEMIANDKMYKKFHAVGGGGQGLSAIEKSLTPSNMDKVMYAVNYYNNLTETLFRFSEFKNVYSKDIKSGLSESDAIRNALYASDNITVNFSRSGSIGKSIDAFVPYLNPAIQGTDKYIRDYVINSLIKNKNPAPILKTIGAVTIPTFISYNINKTLHKEAYENLPDYEKDNYYIWFYNDKDYYRIPKTRETSLILSSFFERLLRRIEGDEKAFDGIVKHFRQVGLPMNPTESHLLMSKEYIQRNRDFFDREIVPQYLLEYSTKNQYDEKTSELAKKLGSLPIVNKLGEKIYGKEIGPKQIDFLANQYLNVYWKFYASAENFFTGKNNETLKKNILNVTGLGSSSDYKNKQITNFYDNRDIINTTINDYDKEYELSKIRKNTKSQKLEKIKINSALGPEATIYNKLKALKKEIDKSNTKMKEFRDEKDLESVNEEAKKMNEKINKLKSLIKK